MSRSTGLSDALRDYVRTHGVRESAALARCREATDKLGPAARMQISPEQGAFMAVFARATDARRAVEVGVFTGYSSTAVAQAMRERHGAQALLVACDLSEDYLARAREVWREAGVEDVVQARPGPADASLQALIDEGLAGTFDLAFVDADKTGYDRYYELCLTLLRPGGTILIDNMFWGGSVADPQASDADTTALRALARKIADDPRVDMTLASIGDGLSLAVKR